MSLRADKTVARLVATFTAHMRDIMLGALLALASFGVKAQVTQLEASYRFLVSDRAHGGVLDRNAYPLSFIDSADYWGLHVCQWPTRSCAVRDIYNPADYSLTAELTGAGDLQVERVNVHNGSNIYDVATWQIAVMLGRVKNGFTLPNNQDAYALASRPNQRLSADQATRATTRSNVFIYNGQSIGHEQQAYAFRMLAGRWLVDDPFKDTPYAEALTVEQLPANPEYQRGKLSWVDWKPFTGENAWALLIGPLQAAHIHYVLERKQRFVPLDDQTVQNAINVLPTFAAMQSPLGAVYYAPAGTLGNKGKLPVNPHEVSVENNFSLYAGLKILQATLSNELSYDATLKNDNKTAINIALKTIATMIDGGVYNNQRTAGMLAFFKNNAWKNGEFVQGGLANDPQQPQAWVPSLKPKAVDVNTWGIATLGTAQVDSWFGIGAAYKAWQQVKRWGGYGQSNQLWGVGYSEQDGNGMDEQGQYRQGVLSAEWTAGAINMVRNMLRHYRAVTSSSPDFKVAQQYVKTLAEDEAAMLAGVQTLRLSAYKNTKFPGKPVQFDRLVSLPSEPYLYASRRYAIPFGWYANPLPSTCATAWMLMIADDFDPLSYAGKAN